MAVKEKEIKEFATLGSGSGYANDILIHGYDFNIYEDNADKLAIQAVLNASIYDKNSGESIHTYQVTNKRVYPFEPCRALRGYLDYFDHYNPIVMLFLIYEANARTHLLSTDHDHVIEFFRPHGDILVGHRVDEHKSTGHAFFFHRLIFTKPQEAKKVLKCPMVKMCVTNDYHMDPCPIYSVFPYKASLDGGSEILEVSLRIYEGSEDVVRLMMAECPVKNAWYPNVISSVNINTIRL